MVSSGPSGEMGRGVTSWTGDVLRVRELRGQNCLKQLSTVTQNDTVTHKKTITTSDYSDAVAARSALPVVEAAVKHASTSDGTSALSCARSAIAGRACTIRYSSLSGSDRMVVADIEMEPTRRSLISGSNTVQHVTTHTQHTDRRNGWGSVTILTLKPVNGMALQSHIASRKYKRLTAKKTRMPL